MKEKTVGVYCPSYRRSDCIMTQNILNDVTYVVRASEEEVQERWSQEADFSTG